MVFAEAVANGVGGIGVEVGKPDSAVVGTTIVTKTSAVGVGTSVGNVIGGAAVVTKIKAVGVGMSVGSVIGDAVIVPKIKAVAVGISVGVNVAVDKSVGLEVLLTGSDVIVEASDEVAGIGLLSTSKNRTRAIKPTPNTAAPKMRGAYH